MTLLFMVTGVECNVFLDELKVSLDKLQDTVDKISLEQILTSKKVDQLEEKIDKFVTKVITVEDLNEVNNNISDAINELKNELKTFTLEKYAGNGCYEAENSVPNIANENQHRTNLTEGHTDALNHIKEVEENGKNMICLPIYDLHCLMLFQ